MLRRQPLDRSDRGFTIVGFILASLTVMTTVAAVAAGVVISNRKKLNPNNFSISILRASAVRDPKDLPVITVSYRVSFTSVAAVTARQTPVHVRCVALDGASRVFADIDQSIEPHNVYEFGDSVLAFGEQHRGVEGPVEVRCFLKASGETLDGKTTTVTVPAAATSGGGGGGTSDQVDGKYTLTFTRSEGSDTECVVDGDREITVTALTASTIKVSLGEGGDEFTSALSGDLKYAGSLALNPGFADYYGRMDGQFASTANGIQVGGLMRTEHPACTFSFQGSLH